jgi:tetratricopeptide (TPR) repeat protein
VPADVETIVAKALEKAKERRYQSVAEFASDIRRFVRNEPIVARPKTTLYQLKKFAMRNRGLSMALCGVALALVAGLISTSIYAYRAQQQQSVAEDRFEDLRSFAQKVIVDYQNMQREKGETKAREYLSTMAQEYLDEMARDTKGLDLRVLADLAKAYTAIGDVQGRPFGSNLGNPKAARENYNKSVAIYEDIVKRDPMNPTFKRELAIACERLGNIHLSDQRYDAALTWYQRSHSLKSEIVDEDITGQRNLSYSYSKLGDVFIKIDRQDEAYDMYAKSLDIRKRLADASPDDDSIQRAYTVGVSRFADALIALDRKEEALNHYEVSLNRRLKRLKSQPDNHEARMDAAVGHLKHGEVLALLDRTEDALTAFGASREIIGGLAADDPSNETARLGVAQMTGKIAQSLFEAGRMDEAMEELAVLFREFEEDVAVESMHTGLQQILAESYWLRGKIIRIVADAEADLSEKAKKNAKSCAALQKSRELHRLFIDEDSAIPNSLVEDLANCQLEPDGPP